MFKMYKAKFATSHLTADILRNDYKWVADDKVIELIAEALRNANDFKVGVAEWNYSPGNFSIIGHNEDNDAPLKELIWSVEQDGGVYCEDRERFESDWKKGQYDPDGSMHFEKDWFEILEFVKEVIDFKVFSVGIDRMEYIAAMTSDEALKDHLTRADYSEDEMKDVSVSKVLLDSIWNIEQETGGYKKMTIAEYLSDFTYKEPTVIGADE